MIERVVKPNILDSLEPSDPVAIRSRKDLRKINWLMQGEDWILSKLSEFNDLKKVVEIGAGNGHLASKIKTKFPTVEVIAIDLTERPAGIHAGLDWSAEDALLSQSFSVDTIVITNLFIHRLDNEGLWQLSKRISKCRAIIMSEPHRYWFTKLLAYPLFPFINRVTRHDITTSIQAGFRFGELAGLIDVDWHWDERAGLGSIRSVAKQVNTKQTELS